MMSCPLGFGMRNEMDLIQDNGQPRYGRFQVVPTQISVENYLYKTPYGKVLMGWQKQLKYKKFKFCSIQHKQYSLGIAVVDLTWVGHGFFYIYDHQSNQVIEWNAIQPLARQTQVDEQPFKSQSFFKKKPYELHMNHSSGIRSIQVKKQGEILLQAEIFTQGTDVLSMCSPTGIHGWTYTQKQTTLAVQGFFKNLEGRVVDFDLQSMAALDDSCGFLRPETAWFWLSCSFWDSKNRKIGINLASGVNESFGNENALWIDGLLYPLADVLFERVGEQYWIIRSLDEKLKLEVETGWCRQESLNLYIVGSQFNQWQARVTGSYEFDVKNTVIWERELGVLEQHYAKW